MRYDDGHFPGNLSSTNDMSHCQISVLDINQSKIQIEGKEGPGGSINCEILFVLKVVVMLSDLQHMGDGTVNFTSRAAGDESQVDMRHDSSHPES